MSKSKAKKKASPSVLAQRASRRMNSAVRWAESELGKREQIRSVCILLGRMLKRRGVDGVRFGRTIVKAGRQHAAAHLAERLLGSLLTEASPAPLVKCGDPRGVVMAIAHALGDWGPLDAGEGYDLVVLADVVEQARSRAMGMAAA